jgi:hypothetical protein
MSIRAFAATLAIAAVTAVPALAHAGSPDRPPCILNDHHIVSVAPIQVEAHEGKATYQRTRGAQVYLQAEPGLTAEWLQLQLERHLTEMKGAASMPDCAFDLSNVRVDVTSSGPGFLVRLTAPDTKTGEEVLRRVQLLVS